MMSHNAGVNPNETKYVSQRIVSQEYTLFRHLVLVGTGFVLIVSSRFLGNRIIGDSLFGDSDCLIAPNKRPVEQDQSLHCVADKLLDLFWIEFRPVATSSIQTG